MSDDLSPLAINPFEFLPPDDGSDVDRVAVYHPVLSSLTSALTIAQSGILSVQDTAAVLRCSVDTVRRIPMEDLASFDGPGRCVLYRMEDVQRYLNSRKRHQKRRSGLGQLVNFRPDPDTSARNLAADALKALNEGAGA